LKELIKTKVRELNLRMELFTYLGAVPLAAIFLILSNKTYYEKFYFFSISVVVAIAVTLLVFPFLRGQLFTHLFTQIVASKTSAESSICKEKLLNFPNYCGILVQAQWTVGLTTSFLVYSALSLLQLLKLQPIY
jgi:hypothetical protein